ncbi:MAG: hypothetical protein AAFP98_03290 [Pseudomonadota bacterium]
MTISFFVNLVVLGLVVPAIMVGSTRMTAAFGPDTDARKILICIYSAIWLTSLLGLGLVALNRLEDAVVLAVGLLSLQIIYKVLTGAVVGLGNPVVMTNLPIAALHSATLLLILMRG